MKRIKILLLNLDSRNESGNELQQVFQTGAPDSFQIKHELVEETGVPQATKRLSSILSTFSPALIFLVFASGSRSVIPGLFKVLRAGKTPRPVIAVINSGAQKEVAEALYHGANDFLIPHFRAMNVLPRLWRCVEETRPERESIRDLKEQLGLKQFIGESPALLAEIKKIPAIARCAACVLIAGETGTGKEICARAIHYLSARSARPFVAVNCGAIPPELVENELFGHESGAFTSAVTSSLGLVRGAEGGTLFLDEIDSLPVLAQVKLLRLLQENWTPVVGQQFEYGFDDIGNRTTTKGGGDSGGANLRLASYTNNSLNQITGRDVPSYVNVIGAATATATNVNVNNAMAYRKGEYYRVELNPINTSVAVWQSVTNRAVQSGTTNSVTGNAFLSKTAEVFGYDLDGNLTNDGRWAYVWAGENRLFSMTSRPSSPAGSSNALRFVYDWQGRRISKTVSNYSGSAWSKIIDEKYLCDGWNQLASLNVTNSAVVCAFLWGNDLRASMQGAGGVGGLLAAKASGVSVAFAAYDGNGNVTALANAANGSMLANYEYGPFGEVIRSSEIAAKTNPFSFSTKFQDDETDLLYYGYRYLNPNVGRWLNRDPLGEFGFTLVHESRDTQRKLTTNPYVLTENNPIIFIDPNGLESVFIKLVTEIRPPDLEQGQDLALRRGQRIREDSQF